MNSDTTRFHTIEDVTETKAMPVADTETIAPVTGLAPAAEPITEPAAESETVPETKVMPVAEPDTTAVLPVPEDAVATAAMPTVQDGTVTETLAPVTETLPPMTATLPPMAGDEEPRTIALESVADVVDDSAGDSADATTDGLSDELSDEPADETFEAVSTDASADASGDAVATEAIDPVAGSAAEHAPEPTAESASEPTDEAATEATPESAYESTAMPADANPDPKSLPIGELPLHGDGIPPATDVPMYGQPSAGREPAAPEAKRGVSVLTIIFGVLGLIIGLTALTFGLVFPNTPIPTFAADPQLVVAIACGSIGVILVIVAIVWAVMGAAKQRKTQAGQ
ncbi:sodium/calcium exchanger protein [Bifidobacterium miconisargentati]|uniref:sodium/calcium exchanger protein n=1 Tax=Bifidobacterium miconisargentati TaxID=2834437 RepID=UPI001BDD041A|nr:sodium/calcium exchanger protein [Bifidobacterium miconisargentati]MBW3089581.1 hypothetical protein [Bifidobacterium miconisargentati]